MLELAREAEFAGHLPGLSSETNIISPLDPPAPIHIRRQDVDIQRLATLLV
jgi:hypothetical protein